MKKVKKGHFGCTPQKSINNDSFFHGNLKSTPPTSTGKESHRGERIFQKDKDRSSPCLKVIDEILIFSFSLLSVHCCPHSHKCMFIPFFICTYRLANTLNEIEAAGTFKHERVITTPQRSEVKVQGSDAKVVNFCANNYLGLSSHPRIVEAAKHALDTHGFGLSSVRFICGTQDIHKELETAVAKFHGTEDCILYPSCFDGKVELDAHFTDF